MTGYRDLREFLRALESRGDLRRITYPLDPRLEITEVCRRVIKAAGPALLFESPKGASMPLLANLFGTPERVAFAVGKSSVQGLREIGERLALLREPQPPQSLRALWEDLPVYKQILNVPPKVVAKPRFLEVVTTSADVDLDILPMQTCWPEDSAPLITWGLVVTRGPAAKRQNVGIYRQQRLSRNELIMRWLPQRGGALDFAAWKAAHPGKPFPVAVVIGADPASMLAAVAPIPDNIGELQFAGLLRGTRTEVADLGPMKLQVPASAEIVLEGHIDPERTELEGPFGDHTGYYNETQRFPVFVVDKFYRRQAAIYLSTYTGRPPDEPAMLGVAMNELFVPLLRKQFPEIVDFYLPPEACSYRVAVVSIRKEYPGHARRLMMAIWSYLRQFLYTKYIIVVDEDIDIRAWDDVIWALSTRADPDRDLTLLRGTPVDYLDFASPQAGLGGKLGIDATNKLPGETERQWGRPIEMTSEVVARVDGLWRELGL